MVSIKTIEDSIVSHLETEISDPISRTIGSFVDHGKGHYKGKTPRILVRKGGESTSDFTGIGETKQDYDMVFEIVVEVGASVTGTISSTQYSGSELCNLVSQQVSDAMESDITGVKQIQRLTCGMYSYDDTHYYVHRYGIFIVNG